MDRLEIITENMQTENISFVLAENAGYLNIESVCVDYCFRGRGIGTAWIEKLIDAAKSAGFLGIGLTAFPESNDDDIVTGSAIKELMRWYEGLGFEADFNDYDELIEDDRAYCYQTSIFQGPFEYSVMGIDF